MKTHKRKSGSSGLAKLARSRVAAACGGVQTVEFRQWQHRVQAIASEYQSGVRSPQLGSRQGARHRGWIDVEAEFRKQYPDRLDDLLGFTLRDATGTTTLAEDVRWAYSHAMIHSTTEADAPNAGAWLWLLEARENRSQFLGKVFALEQAAHGGKLPQTDRDSTGDAESPEDGDDDIDIDAFFDSLKT